MSRLFSGLILREIFIKKKPTIAAIQLDSCSRYLAVRANKNADIVIWNLVGDFSDACQ